MIINQVPLISCCSIAPNGQRHLPQYRLGDGLSFTHQVMGALGLSLPERSVQLGEI